MKDIKKPARAKNGQKILDKIVIIAVCAIWMLNCLTIFAADSPSLKSTQPVSFINSMRENPSVCKVETMLWDKDGASESQIEIYDAAYKSATNLPVNEIVPETKDQEQEYCVYSLFATVTKDTEEETWEQHEEAKSHKGSISGFELNDQVKIAYVVKYDESKDSWDVFTAWAPMYDEQGSCALLLTDDEQFAVYAVIVEAEDGEAVPSKSYDVLILVLVVVVILVVSSVVQLCIRRKKETDKPDDPTPPESAY